MNDIRFFDRRVNFIIQDTARILELTKSSVILKEFDQSIELLNSYLGEMATLDRAMKQIMDGRRLRKTITIDEESADKAFANKRAGVVVQLKKAVDTVEKRRRVIVRIAEALSKRRNSKTEKTSPKSYPKNVTRKIAISPPSGKIEKDINKAVVELQKEKVKMKKEREKQEKLLAKEREKQEKLLAKEREKQEKLLAKELEKLEKEREKMSKEQGKQAKNLSKERERAIKKQANPATNEQLLKDRVATFVFKKAEFQSLSNFWPCLVTILDGEEVYQYSSGEHAFHGEKYRRLAKLSKDSARTAELLDYSKQFLRCNDGGMSALDAKRKGGKGGLRLTEPELKLWDKLSLDVQREISTWKVNSIPTVRQDLLNTGNRILVHSAMRTSEKEMVKKFWEGKAIVTDNGDIEVLGGNWLGKIWMEVRDKM